MSKESGMGSKRIGSMTSRGMGHCEANSRAEQCGNGRGLNKGKNQGMDRKQNFKDYVHENVATPISDELTSLENQAKALNIELNIVKEKITKLNNKYIN